MRLISTWNGALPVRHWKTIVPSDQRSAFASYCSDMITSGAWIIYNNITHWLLIHKWNHYVAARWFTRAQKGPKNTDEIGYRYRTGGKYGLVLTVKETKINLSKTDKYNNPTLCPEYSCLLIYCTLFFWHVPVPRQLQDKPTRSQNNKNDKCIFV